MKSKFLVYSTAVFCLAVGNIVLPVKAMPATHPVNVAQASTSLTEANVQAVIEQLEAARDSRDVEGTLALIAPFAVTVVTVESGNGLSTVTTRLEGIDAHRQMLEQTFGQVQSREMLRGHIDIDIVNDGFGVAKIYQMENIQTSEGEALIAASQTVLRFGQVNGRVLVTSATVEGWIAARPTEN
ncbi:MAG: hypothetical protein ACHWZW_04390 [Spirulina sp.]